ncbi:MAG: hypothetical protein AMS25_10975 [Gemmatimonas sp. SM23_52]|nr:MAG: hypothetical protein AMS25_10975 [Gemmatimonas sp. SM23_52]
MNRRSHLALLPVLILLVAGQTLAQEDVLGSAGLGRLMRPLDARARGMGGAAVALHGGNLSAVNPASLARVSLPGLWLTLMPESRTVRGDVLRGDIETADFPLGRLAIPFGERWVLGVAFGSFLDQDWSVEFMDTLRLASEDIPFIETRSSDGGVSQLRFELAGVLSAHWALGVSALHYTGEVRRSVEREFPSPFVTYRSATAIQYQGWGLALGAEYQPIREMILGAVASWGPGLEVRNDSTGGKLDLDLPLSLQLGGSWQLTPDFVAALALGWEGWSVLDAELPEPGSSDVWRVGTGVEFRALSGPTSALFVRLGGSLERKPFRLGSGAPWERAVGLGIGAHLREGRGRLDAAVEFGRRADRSKHGVEESFRRLTFSMAVFTQ